MRWQSRNETSLRPIRPVDVDIAVREVAGPNARVAFTEAEIDADLDVAAGDRLGRGGFVILKRAFTVFGDELAAEGDLELVAVGRLPRFRDRHHAAPPIRARPRDG